MYFKKNNGLRTLRFIWYSSVFFLLTYFSLVILSLNEFQQGKEVWQNFEGLVMYSLMTGVTTSLFEYSKSKLKDFERALA
jgi:hypothetical protein